MCCRAGAGGGTTLVHSRTTRLDAVRAECAAVAGMRVTLDDFDLRPTRLGTTTRTRARTDAFVRAVVRDVVAAVFTVVLLAASAPAAATPVWLGLVSRPGVEPAEEAALDGELARALAARDVRNVAPPKHLDDDEANGSLAAVDRALDDALQAFDEDDFESARADALQALELFEKKLAFVDDEAAWARHRRIRTLQVLAALRLRDTSGADDVLRQMLAIEPGWRPDPKKAPADLLKRYQAVSSSMHGVAPTVLELKSRPAGARASVDGRAVGTAPVVVDIAAGVHYVVLQSPVGTARERVFVPPTGTRITARLGSPEQEAAKVLLSTLARPGASATAVTEQALDVADDVIVAVALPWRERTQLVAARIVDGTIVSVVGTRTAASDGAREQAVFELVQGVFERKTDAWVGAAAKEPASSPGAPGSDPRAEFLGGRGLRAETEAPPVNPLVVVGSVAGLVVLGGGIGLGVAAYLQGEDDKNRGFHFVVDGSGLQ